MLCSVVRTSVVAFKETMDTYVVGALTPSACPFAVAVVLTIIESRRSASRILLTIILGTIYPRYSRTLKGI